MADFRPVLYLKQSCPFCLKLMIFLSEGGLLHGFDIRKFLPGDAQEQAIRDELAPHFEKVTFPAVQLEPGRFMNGTEDIIAHYAGQNALDPTGMLLLNYYTGGVFEHVRQLFMENMELKKQLA